MITRFFRRIYSFLDKWIVTPISRAFYNISKALKKRQGNLDKLLNRPHFLIYVSLVIAVALFLLIDSKVINLVETDAEIITNVPVLVKYNEEAYVIDGVPDTIDITITGRKSDIYLAKQLSEFEVILDLSEYKPSNNPYRVKFTYSKSINSLNYKLDPSYVQVTIKNKESQIKDVKYDLLNIDSLDSKLSISDVKLSQTEAVVKGGSDDLEKVASVRALIDLKKENFTDKDKGEKNVNNVELVAYSSDGSKLDNIEIVPHTISATLTLESYSKTVPIKLETTGTLVTGKAIAAISINNETNYNITIYGEQSELDKIDSVPLTIDVNGLGNESAKTYNATITKPGGVRQMSTDKVTIKVSFGEETQKTVSFKTITPQNLLDGYAITQIGDKDLTVQVKGVESVLEKITDNSISAVVDCSNITKEGEYELDVVIADKDPLVTYVVSSKMKAAVAKSN